MAYPLRPGVTFTYLGLAVDKAARVLNDTGNPFDNLFAAGEIVSGNVLTRGYLAGFGLTIGSVFGRIAGTGAAMPELLLLEEAQRQFEICNACRYCEGLCAVFPALERRSVFDEGDVTQLANLCHDCRECYYVCPFAPPHEFAVNIPLVMSQVREESYRRFARPAWLAPLMGRRLPAALGLPALLIAGVVLATITLHGVEGLLQPQVGDGAFYRVIPWLAMVLPALLLSGFAVTVLLWGMLAYWRDTGAQGLLHGVTALAHGTLDVAFLRNLRGGGPGCTHPDERPSNARWVYHMLVFYGFISAFIATVLAAVYQDFFGVLPPYDYLSAPVLFGIAGGIGRSSAARACSA